MLEPVTKTKWIEVNGAYCCVPNKCGSSSFRVSVAGLGKTVNNFELYEMMHKLGRGPWSIDEINAKTDGKPRFLAVREPVDRFTSLWKHANRENETLNKRGFLGAAGLLRATPGRLMWVIEHRPDEDPHWTRQSFWEVEDVIPIRFDKFLAAVGLPPMHKNKSSEVPIPPLPEERIRAHYARDCELWEMALVNDF